MQATRSSTCTATAPRPCGASVTWPVARRPFGAAFAAFGALGDRLESVDLGGVKLSIRDMAQETFSLAKRAEELGDTEAATRLRAIGQQLEELADEYRRIRSAMPAGDERTKPMDAVVRRAAALAQRRSREGADSLHQAEAAIERGSSPFEIYHGLVLARAMVDTLSRGRQEQLRRAVTKVRRGRLARRDKPIRKRAEGITAAIDARR